MRAELDKFTNTLRGLVIEDIRKGRIVLLGAREIIELALAGEASPLTGRDPAGNDVITIAKSESNMRRFYFGRNFANGS